MKKLRISIISLQISTKIDNDFSILNKKNNMKLHYLKAYVQSKMNIIYKNLHENVKSS